jgi:AcrR family transcriptional regulator
MGRRVISGDSGKPGRTYSSVRRAQAASGTRAAILAAALRLFRDHGYGMVTVQDIAREASAAVPTVYASTGGKAAILGILIDEAMQVSVAEANLAAVDECEDPHGAIRTLVHGTRVDNERHHDIVKVMRDAAAVEQTAADILARSDGIYRGYLARAMDRIGETGALKPGLTRPRAVDIAWFYLGHESWHALAVARQWGWEETELWLADQLTAALLGALQ